MARMSFSNLPFAIARRFLLVAACAFGCGAGAMAQIYNNDFEKAEIGKTPEDFTIVAGVFTVQQEGGNKFLELPGAPLETFGFLFGPPAPGDAVASARIFGTKQGRKFPAFGLSLNGVSGYRLQLSPGKKMLEIYKGDEVVSSVPFEWSSGAWTKLRLQVRQSGKGWAVEGKAWTDGTPEPAAWTVKFEDPELIKPGRAGIWASPYAGTPIRFDDLRLELETDAPHPH